MFLRPTPDDLARPAPVRRRPLDSPRVLVVVAVLLVAILAALFWLADQTSRIAPTLVADVLLYALFGVDLVLLVALVFVLARNLLKLWVEQRTAAPLARFRAKLVFALLAMTIVPAVLVLFSGSQMIRESAANWFSAPVDDVMNAAQAIAHQYTSERQAALTARAERLAGMIPAAAIASADVATLNELAESDARVSSDGMVELYRTVSDPGHPA